MTIHRKEQVIVNPAPNIKVWEIMPNGKDKTATATVGFDESLYYTGIRIEFAKRLNKTVPEHKDRIVATKCINPKIAREIAQAIIEACDQFDKGIYQIKGK